MKVLLENEKLARIIVKYIRESDSNIFGHHPLSLMYDYCSIHNLDQYQIDNIILYRNITNAMDNDGDSVFFSHVEFPSEEFYTNFLLRYV